MHVLVKAIKRTTIIADFLIPSTPKAFSMYEGNGGHSNKQGDFNRENSDFKRIM